MRAANTGISGAVDRQGRVIDALAIDAHAYFDVDLPVPTRASRPGLPYGVIGLAIVGLFGLFAAAAIAVRRIMSN